MDIKLMNWLDENIFSISCKLFKSNCVLSSEVKRILVIKNWALGDSVCLLPMIKALKLQYPNVQLDVLAHNSNKCVFEDQPFIDNVISFGILGILRCIRNNYDICIDAGPFLNVSAVIARLSGKFTIGFSHGIRSNLYDEVYDYNKKIHIVKNYLQFSNSLGSKYKPSELEPLIINDRDFCIVWDFLRTRIYEKDFVVGICPGVAESVKYRMWPSERFAELADKLIKDKKKVIFIDSKANKPVVDNIISMMKYKNDVINFAGQFTIKQSAQVINNCDVVISNDSGMMHVAAAMKCKVIGLFGVNTPVIWGPYGKGNISLFKPKKGCPFLNNIDRKLIPDKLTEEQLTCMDAISVNDVYRCVK